MFVASLSAFSTTGIKLQFPTVVGRSTTILNAKLPVVGEIEVLLNKLPNACAHFEV